jgi:hypothetical protein
MKLSTPTSEYMLLFHGPDWDQGMTREQTQKILDHATAWAESLGRRGKVKAGQALLREGCIVSGKKGGIVMDGPFAESKETIGGYLLLQETTYEEAVAFARECPTLEYGISIEIRPAIYECPITKRLNEQATAAAI